MVRGPCQPPGSAGGVAAVAIMTVPCSAAGHACPLLGHVPESCAAPHRLPFPPVPVLDEPPGPGHDGNGRPPASARAMTWRSGRLPC
jgi:hypothetical protein